MKLDRKCSTCAFYNSVGVKYASVGMLNPVSFCTHESHFGCYVPSFTTCDCWKVKFDLKDKICELNGLVEELGCECSTKINKEKIKFLCDKIMKTAEDIGDSIDDWD